MTQPRLTPRTSVLGRGSDRSFIGNAGGGQDSVIGRNRQRGRAAAQVLTAAEIQRRTNPDNIQVPSGVPRAIPENIQYPNFNRFSSIATDEEFRDWFGLPPSIDVVPLRYNPAATTLVNKQFPERLALVNESFEASQLPSAREEQSNIFWRFLKGVANKIYEIDVGLTTDSGEVDDPNRRASFGEMLLGGVIGGLDSALEAEVNLSTGFERDAAGRPASFLETYGAISTEILGLVDRAFPIGNVEEFNADIAARERGGATPQQARFNAFQARTDIPEWAKFGLQIVTDPAAFLGVVGWGRRLPGALGTGLRAKAGPNTGRIVIGEYPTEAATLSRTSPTRLGQLPLIRSITKRLDPSSELAHLPPDSQEHLVVSARTLFQRDQDTADRLRSTLMSQLEAEGDDVKIFGLSAADDFMRANNIPGKPFIGDVLEAEVPRAATRTRGLGRSRQLDIIPRNRATLRADESFFEIWAKDPTEPLAAVFVGPTRSGTIKEANVTITPLVAEGKPGSITAKGVQNIFSRSEVFEVAEAIMQQTGTTKLSGFRVTGSSVSVSGRGGRFASITKEQVRKALGGREIIPARRGKHTLTHEQSARVELWQDLYKNLLTYQRRYGLDTAEFGELRDAFHFVSRWAVKNQRYEIQPAAGRAARGRPGFTKSRYFREDMAEGAKEGTIYAKPMDTANHYLQSMFNRINVLRQDRFLAEGGLFRTQKVSSRVITARNIAKFNVNTQRNAITAVTRAISQEAHLPGQTISAMKRAFPSLTDEITRAFGIKAPAVGKVIRQMADFMESSLKVDRRTFRQAMRAIEVGSDQPTLLKRSTVLRAVSQMGVDQAQQSRVVERIFSEFVKARSADQKAVLGQLREQMTVLTTDPAAVAAVGGEPLVARQVLARAQAQVRQATKRAATPRAGEGVARSFPGRIIGGPEGAKIAAKLDAFMDPTSNTVLKALSKVTDVLRTMRTGLDPGFIFIQGLPTLMRDPETWGRATGMSLRSFFDGRVRARYVRDNVDDIVDMIQHGGHLGSTEFTESIVQGGYLAAIPVKLDNGPAPFRAAAPAARVVHRTLQRFQTSFDMFLDLARIETYKALKPAMTRTATTELARNKNLDELADFVNKLTGVTSSRALGASVTQQQLEGAIFMFSPRYTRAIVGLFLDITRSGVRGEQARKTLGSLMVGQYALHIGAAAMMGQEPNLIPGRGDWLKLKMGGQMVGFGGKPNALINMATDLIEQTADNPRGWLSWSTWKQSTYENNSFLRRLRYQLPPIMQEVTNVITGADPIGRMMPDDHDFLDWGAYAGTRFMPFAIEALIESGRGRGIAFTSEWFGGLTHPVQPYEFRDDLYNKYSRETFGVSYDTLQQDIQAEAKKAQLRLEHSDLQDAVDTAQKAQELYFRSQERVQIQTKTKNANDIRHDKWVDLNDRFHSGIEGARSGRKFRDEFSKIARADRAVKSAIRRDHAQAFADFDTYYEGEGATNQTIAATNEFMDRFFGTEVLDFSGQINYALREKLEREFRGRYGDDVVEAMFDNMKRRLLDTGSGPIPESIREYIRSWDVLEPYWENYKQVLPEEQWPLWEMFESSTPIQKQAFRESRKFPFIQMEEEIKLEREYMQAENEEIDWLLIRFYDKSALHPNNERKLAGLAP